MGGSLACEQVGDTICLKDVDITKYDSLIYKSMRGLKRYNTLAMTEQDLVQHGRVEVLHAIRNYRDPKFQQNRKNKEGFCSESTYVYRHLFFRFGNLFYKSLTLYSNTSKHESFQHFKSDATRSPLSDPVYRSTQAFHVSWEQTGGKNGNQQSNNCCITSDSSYAGLRLNKARFKNTAISFAGDNVDEVDPISRADLSMMISSLQRKSESFRSEWASWQSLNEILPSINRSAGESDVGEKIDAYLKQVYGQQTVKKLTRMDKKIRKIHQRYAQLEQRISAKILSEAYYKRIVSHDFVESVLRRCDLTKAKSLKKELLCQLEW